MAYLGATRFIARRHQRNPPSGFRSRLDIENGSRTRRGEARAGTQVVNANPILPGRSAFCLVELETCRVQAGNSHSLKRSLPSYNDQRTPLASGAKVK